MRQLVVPAERRRSVTHEWVELGADGIFSLTFGAISGKRARTCCCFTPSLLLWPCFVCSHFFPISHFVCPCLAASFTDTGSTVKAEKLLQKSTGMFFVILCWTWKYICSIQKHSITVFSNKHYLYMNKKKNGNNSDCWVLFSSLLFDIDFTLSRQLFYLHVCNSHIYTYIKKKFCNLMRHNTI